MTKKTYLVAKGVEWVDGRRVPADRTVHLTDEEAKFDLGLGRIDAVSAAIESLADAPVIPASTATPRPARQTLSNADA